METKVIENNVLETAREVITKMGFNPDFSIINNNNTRTHFFTLAVAIANEPGFLIGKNGATLEALEHLIKTLVNKKHPTEERFNFVLDINNYRKLKTNQITDLAKTVAQRVIQTSRAEALQPMTSYERRLVHMELEAFDKIATESIGEEPKRRIVIKPLLDNLL